MTARTARIVRRQLTFLSLHPRPVRVPALFLWSVDAPGWVRLMFPKTTWCIPRDTLFDAVIRGQSTDEKGLSFFPDPAHKARLLVEFDGLHPDRDGCDLVVGLSVHRDSLVAFLTAVGAAELDGDLTGVIAP